ncbi:MAG: LuxR C-terminal-related transcriptional regulator [Planctomycetota bacterium]
MKTAPITVLDPDVDRGRRIVGALALAELSANTSPFDSNATTSKAEFSALTEPHCFLVGITVPVTRAVEVVNRIARGPRPVTIVAYGSHPTVEGVVALMRAGAHDVVTRIDDGHSLASSVRAALEHDREVLPRRRRSIDARRRVESLSRRERQVFGYVLSGYSPRRMGEALGVSVKTIEAHRANLMKKAGCKTVVEIVQLASDAEFQATNGPPQVEIVAAPTSGDRKAGDRDPGDRSPLDGGPSPPRAKSSRRSTRSAKG